MNYIMNREAKKLNSMIPMANASESSADDLWEVAACLIDEFREMANNCLATAATLQPLADLQPRHED